MFARYASEHSLTGLNFDEIEIERDEDAWLASRGDQCAQLFETVETGADLFRKTHECSL